MALVACPTGSIGATQRHDAHIGIDAFPLPLDENVYFCGFTSESSFGAWSYLITRPASGCGEPAVMVKGRMAGWSVSRFFRTAMFRHCR